MSSNVCQAWMLPLGEGRHVAIGEAEMVHIIPDWLRLQSIPLCPVYCHKVFMWQGQLIPVFDLRVWLQPGDKKTTEITKESVPIICIVGFAAEDHTTSYGGMQLNALPFRTEVHDDQICEFPDDDKRWSAIAVSCFSGPGGGPTPVLELSRMFCSQP